ncbi:MAG: c-type cytochrome [Pedobacter sp.]|nr:MAG: c-type cytochrome [Pedobacter sp.]
MRRYIIGALFFLTVATIVYSCQSAEQLKQDMYYTNGRDLYLKHCQNCHGTNGEGLAKLSPPLTDTVFLKENKNKIACYIKNGLKDTITVHGIKYDVPMPEHNFADIDIAQLIVYITNTFGNTQGHYTPEQVAADLADCK